MKIGKVVFGLIALIALSAVAIRAEEASDFVWQSDMGAKQLDLGAWQPGSGGMYPDVSVRPASALVGKVQDDGPPKPAATEDQQPAGQWHKPAPKAAKPPVVHPKAGDPEAPVAAGEASGSKPRVLPGMPTPSAKEPLPRDPADSPAKDKGVLSPLQKEKPAVDRPVAGGAACVAGYGSCGGDSCPGSGCRSGGDACEDPAWRLFSSSRLDDARLRIRGWIDQGSTWNPDRPVDRFNGPVTFNDRSNEYQMNQLYLSAERKTQNDGWGFDWGGRVDFLYGTDSRFLVANGLETTWNESRRFYGAALPQLYADFAYDDLTLRIGHFYNIMDFESPMAPENFFYSHSYSFQYGEPLTFTGILGMFKLNDCWSVSAGVHRGWNQWEDNNDKAGLLFGVTWTSPDDNTLVNFAITLSNEQVDRPSRTSAYSIVVSHRFSDRVRYAFEHNAGQETNAVARRAGGFADAEWFSFVNYLFYDLSPCWSAGVRYEWFGDSDGTRVVGLGAPKGFPWAGIPSHWDELALGVNYRPNHNVALRSEFRFDWADPIGFTPLKAFDDFSSNHQFLWATDLIVKF
jgi:hypothetical protein